MISTPQTELISKCKISAMVFGKGTEVKLVYLSETNPRAEFAAAVRAGFMYAGLFGIANDGSVLVELEEPKAEAAGVMGRLAADIALGTLHMKGAPSN
jgi:hypothetical protein